MHVSSESPIVWYPIVNSVANWCSFFLYMGLIFHQATPTATYDQWERNRSLSSDDWTPAYRFLDILQEVYPNSDPEEQFPIILFQTLVL